MRPAGPASSRERPGGFFLLPDSVGPARRRRRRASPERCAVRADGPLTPGDTGRCLRRSRLLVSCPDGETLAMTPSGLGAALAPLSWNRRAGPSPPASAGQARLPVGRGRHDLPRPRPSASATGISPASAAGGRPGSRSGAAQPGRAAGAAREHHLGRLAELGGLRGEPAQASPSAPCRATFFVPYLNCAKSPGMTLSSVWVGLDGYVGHPRLGRADRHRGRLQRRRAAASYFALVRDVPVLARPGSHADPPG